MIETTAKLDRLKMGARFLNIEEINLSDLGALAPLIGNWKNAPIDPKLISTGWNVISVPGVNTGGFVFEVIPYTETLKFSPVVVQAGNRGPVENGQQVEQLIFGLFYEQQIVSVCDTKFCSERNFSAGTTIHAETGLFLNLGDPNGGYSIARLATIPHGNSVLALGNSSQVPKPGTHFFSTASAVPTTLSGEGLLPLGYTDPVTRTMQFPNIFDQKNPNSFLEDTLKALVADGSLTDMSVLEMSTITPNANGGILNIPFIQTNVNATSMDATFWIENIDGGEANQVLQYSQTINLVFPPTGKATPIVWPHITINSLVRDLD